MQKKLLVLVLVLMMVFTCVACGETEPQDVVGGGTTVTETTADDIARFNKAMGLDLTDVTLVSIQVVAGTNYTYEYVDETGAKKTVTIYEDLEGNLEVLED